MITLQDLVDAGNSQVQLKNTIELYEKRLSEKKEEYRKLSEETLPNMMAEVGLESFTLPEGYKISIADKYYAKLPEDCYHAFQWLRDNNMDGVIKTEVTLNFGKGEDEIVQKVQEVLSQMGLVPNVKSNVHHMTLRALVREQIEKGANIPLEAFGAGLIRTSVVSK